MVMVVVVFECSFEVGDVVGTGLKEVLLLSSLTYWLVFRVRLSSSSFFKQSSNFTPRSRRLYMEHSSRIKAIDRRLMSGRVNME